MNKLRTQILLLTVGLVGAVSLTILFTVWLSTAQYSREQVSGNLQRAVSVFYGLLENRETQLIASAEVLTSDFGFKRAVATSDTLTIRSALQNQQQRIGASLMMLIALDGTVEVTSAGGVSEGQAFPHPELIQTALAQGSVATFVMEQGELYQIILLPIRAPVPIGLAGIGFRMDQVLATELQSLSRLDVTFLTDSSGEQRVVASTLLEADQSAALIAPETVDTSFRLGGVGPTFASKAITLAASNGMRVVAVLTAPLADAIRNLEALRDRILFISLLTLAVASIGSALLSRNLAGPLSRLAEIAGDIARGDFQRLRGTEMAQTREIRSLFRAFMTMGREIEEREQRITWQATHDSLTGLLNRNQVLSELDQQRVRPGGELTVLALSISGFKRINDTFGPSIADQCLSALGRRLRQLEAEFLATARLGADEFLCVWPGHFVAAELDQRVAELLRRLAEPYDFASVRLVLSFNAGVAVAPTDGDDANTLVRRAGIALDGARKERRALHVYQAGEEESHLERVTLLRDLEAALANNDGQLFMVFQPKQNLRTGRIEKAEALMRWKHPQRGFVPPDVFVEIAEQACCIDKLTDWVIQQVIAQLQQWDVEGIAVQAAINISAQDLERDDLLTQVQALMAGHRLSSSLVSFELTERDMMQDADKAIRLMQRFREAGFGLSVDDYGIGYSSLSKIQQMPVDELKIDKSFVLKLASNPADQIIVESTIDLAHRFHLKVIAEGVENQESLDMLKRMGCDYVQGYHLARPMPATAFVEWWRAFEGQREGAS